MAFLDCCCDLGLITARSDLVVLYPKEQRRVLELLVALINVGRKSLRMQFRADRLEQIVSELEPIGERDGRTSTLLKTPGADRAW